MKNENRFGSGREGFKLHHHNHGGSGHGGYSGVHHDAELTMIRIGVVGVQVRHLGDGQHGQQGKAQSRNRTHEAAARAEIDAQMCPKCCQTQSPAI